MQRSNTPTQTDQPTPSDNAHTHRDSAHPITLWGLEKDTVLSPYHNSESNYKATFFIFILPRKAKRTFGIIRVILRLTVAVTPKLHLAPRIQPSCPTGLPAFTEYLSRGSLVIGDHYSAVYPVDNAWWALSLRVDTAIEFAEMLKDCHRHISASLLSVGLPTINRAILYHTEDIQRSDNKTVPPPRHTLESVVKRRRFETVFTFIVKILNKCLVLMLDSKDLRVIKQQN